MMNRTLARRLEDLEAEFLPAAGEKKNQELSDRKGLRSSYRYGRITPA